MVKPSAGLLLSRSDAVTPEVLLVHSGVCTSAEANEI